MGTLSVILIVSLAGLFLAYGFPIKASQFTYPHGSSDNDLAEWGSQSLFLAVSALALVCTAVGLLFGCTWCYRHKDCKLFASGSHINDDSTRRAQPLDSGFAENANNNISEDNNNGPISLREMQNIANNNATAYIVSENEERNRTVSRESVVEFEPLPAGVAAVPGPLAHCSDWFSRPHDEIPRNRLQYLREIGRGWFGRIVEGEIESEDNTNNAPVVVKILNPNASLAEKARFLDEVKLYRDVRHENVLSLVTHGLREEPWILIFELCSMDLQQYLISNRPKMAIVNESGMILRLKCDVAAGLAFIHSQNLLYGNVWSGNVLVRGGGENARAVLGRYDAIQPPEYCLAPEQHTIHSEVWSLGVLLWEVCSWGTSPPTAAPLPEPALPCPYRAHLYQVMQLCWNQNPEARPQAAQVHALLNHLYTSHQQPNEIAQDDGYGSNDFEDRWQKLKPNSIPKIDEHIAIVHAPSISTASNFTSSSQDIEENPHTSIQDSLSIDLETAVSRSSSIMSDKDPLSVHIKSESLTNLHGSLEDVRNIYFNHSENMIVDCQQENYREYDNSDSSELKVDPWLKDIIAGSQDDVSYYRDVSDVIKNLDNILNSEKTSSSESSHQASPSRDGLTLDCKKDYVVPSCLVKSPGITNFQSILDLKPERKDSIAECVEEELDREVNEPLNHSFERHSDTMSQNTLENITPDSPHIDVETQFKEQSESNSIPQLKELCQATVNSSISVSELEENYNEFNGRRKVEELSIEKCNVDIKQKVDIEEEEEVTNETKLENVGDNYEKFIDTMAEISDTSTVYMDLNNTDSVNKNKNLDINFKNIVGTFDDYNTNTTLVAASESTVYLDLPSVIKETGNFLDSEREISERDISINPAFANYVTSTPRDSDVSATDNVDKTKPGEEAAKNETPQIKTPITIEDNSTEITVPLVPESEVSDVETEDPNYGPGTSLTKLEQKVVDVFSPFESPSKSLPMDTFDENSSVVLGPFENCTLDFFKGIKTCETLTNEFMDVPKEELLAFSWNFNDINLETPSPLRDGNFLNEVPDIDLNEHIEIRAAIPRLPVNLTQMDNLDLPPLSPTTPPNSPGNFLSNSPQPEYVMEDISDPLNENLPDPISDSEFDSDSQNIDTHANKLAIAENENNLNIEHGSESEILQTDDSNNEEQIISGNGGYFYGAVSGSDNNTLNESMKALRDELELKLPWAQAANVEPPVENDSWSDFPNPPEMVVNYAGALSPIMEETGNQLSAYENDRPWVTIKTDSSESYPEPCNNSTDDVTELPTGVCRDDLTYTLHSNSPINNPTYTIQKDISTSKEFTMSADSLNEPNGLLKKDNLEVDNNVERISQISPFLVSPTMESCVPDQSDNITGVTSSKATVPTDAKASKPLESISKATSIDSWCSNDTLFNVEDNFDDMAADFSLEPKENYDIPRSNSTETLTHHDDKDDLSHCSTYIVHDSKSDSCTVPDSLANVTYNIANQVTDKNSSSVVETRSEPNDSTKNTPTKDMAYETFVHSSCNSNLPTYSNCTTEVLSDQWKHYPPAELVRRSPVTDVLTMTPPQTIFDDKEDVEHVQSPNIENDNVLKKMDSIEITCLSNESMNLNEAPEIIPEDHYRQMASSAQSTPFIENMQSDDSVETVTLEIPQDNSENVSAGELRLTNFQSFFQSVELRPQDVYLGEDTTGTVTTNTDLLLEGGSNLLTQSNITPTYSDFRDSTVTKVQEMITPPSQLDEVNSLQDFNLFESSVRNRPQDLSAIISTSLLLQREVQLSEINGVNLRRKDLINESHGSDAKKVEVSNNETYNSHVLNEQFNTFDSHAEMHIEDASKNEINDTKSPNTNGNMDESWESPKDDASKNEDNSKNDTTQQNEGTETNTELAQSENDEKFAIVNFLSVAFEQLAESNVDDEKNEAVETNASPVKTDLHNGDAREIDKGLEKEVPIDTKNEAGEGSGEKVENGKVTADFLYNEKQFCQYDSCFPLLSDIRFTGPGDDCMSTSFIQESPTEEKKETLDSEEVKENGTNAADQLKEWDSDSDDSHSTNSSSGEFIWKSTQGGNANENNGEPSREAPQDDGDRWSGSGDSGSGSEGDELEFVPSSWDCRAEPSKSSLRSLEQAQPDNKKRVVFKRQKYHCVYEYPREAMSLDALPSPLQSPYLPDYSTYSDWDTASAEEAELGYGQLFGAHHLELFPLQAGVSFDYDEDFFISSSARPFESLGIMPTSSQFFPGMHLKAASMPQRDLPDDEYPAPPSPALTQTRTPSLDFTTPDSGVEDITPGSTTNDEEYKKKLPDLSNTCWRSLDGSSSESVSPSSPASEALGGLRHTRDKLKLDLPPSPHIPSPRHNRVFNFTLEKPKPRRSVSTESEPTTPLIMTDETPVTSTSLPLEADDNVMMNEPTFSTFGKSLSKTAEPEKAIVFDEVQEADDKEMKLEAVKEGATDSGDEDSGIESSKATLERHNPTNVT